MNESKPYAGHSCDAVDELLLYRAGVPRRHWDSTFDSCDIDGKLKETCVEFLHEYQGCDHGFLFYGPPCCGKTRLAVALLKGLILEHGARGWFTSHSDRWSRVQATCEPNCGFMRDELLRRAIEPDVLVLDDLFNRDILEWPIELLSQVLARRCEDGAMTIITTTLPPYAADGLSLEGKMGIQLVDQLHEVSMFFGIPARGLATVTCLPGQH